MAYTVKQLAKLAGVSVRTLHYYDSIGLLKPSYVRPNGYSAYEQPELVKLQQILFFKELEFPLARIIDILNSPGFDVAEALRDQRTLIEMQQQRLDGLLSAIDTTMRDLRGETEMNIEELYSSFTKEQIKEYRQEVMEKWGEETLRRSEERVMG
jgi:DNA-binding transcriptional MerR regulator